MPVKQRKVRWWVTTVVVGVVLVASVAQSFAAEPADLRRLALENQVAQLIADLKLTAGQKAQLKEIVDRFVATAGARNAELAELLAKRRDALLSGDQQAVEEATRALRELASKNPWAGDESAREFVSGLTERQKQLLESVLPGIGSAGTELDRNRWERRAPAITPGRTLEGMHGRMPGFRLAPGEEMHTRRVIIRTTPAAPVLRLRSAAGTEYLSILSELLGR